MTTIYEGRQRSANGRLGAWQEVPEGMLPMWQDLTEHCPDKYELREAQQVTTLNEFCRAAAQAGLVWMNMVTLPSDPPHYKTTYIARVPVNLDVTDRLHEMAKKLGIYK